MASVEASSYKEEHEKFVSGLSGTSVFEIALVVSTAPVAVLLRNVIYSWLYCPKNVDSPHFVCKFALDFTTLILPVLAAFTVAADHLDAVYSIMIVIILGLLIFTKPPVKNNLQQSVKSLSDTVNMVLTLEMKGKRPFISSFRAYVNIATAIAILAVDFAVFPRRFAKAETYGTGLMDVGVGAFIVSNALVSPEARGKYTAKRSPQAQLKSIMKVCTSTIPLWVLGFIRLAAVKSTDYQEHVSEYGVHWNFFFTLAVVKIMSTIILCLVDPKYSWVISTVIAVNYQYLLTRGGLTDYIINGSDGLGGRHGLIDANREGLLSSFGYLSLYFFGVQLGMFLFKNRSLLKHWIICALLIILLDAVIWVCLWWCEEYIEQVSRRMANLAFVIWMIGYNLQLICCFLLVDILGVVLSAFGLSFGRFEKGEEKVKKVEAENNMCLLEAINRNGLFYFLLANLFTGLVNFSMKTIYVIPSKAFSILSGYMLALSIVMYGLDINNISLKFW